MRPLDSMKRKSSTKGIVFGLACSDLKHEWILTACLIMAITAVLSPLLLMFGLKFGIIDVALKFMVTDPRYREIRPLASKSYDKAWFDVMRQRPDVDFIIPMTRNISATVDVGIKGKVKKERLSIVPTAPGDPLLTENGVSVPAAGECVLTQLASEALQAEPGDILIATASRIRGSGFEYGAMDLKVSGVLGIRASGLKGLYVQLNVLEAVEQFKDGQAVSEFGWSGSLPSAYPLYDGLIIALPEKLTKIKELSLCNRTGFSKIEPLDQATLVAKAGYGLSSDMAVYRLYTLKTPAGEESIKEVRARLRGQNARIFPWVAPIQASLIDETDNEIATLSLMSLPVDKTAAKDVDLSVVPEWGATQATDKDMLKIMLPSGVSANGRRIYAKIKRNLEYISFPLTIIAQRNETQNVAFIPEKLAGILRLYQERNIRYDEDAGKFILFRQGYAAFRMYAKTIFDVDKLRKFFERQSLLVYTEIQAINKIINLNKGMALIFTLLAMLGITGCAASLTASLYASVERKKRELSVLRLLGLSGFNLFRFPVYQGVLIGTGGFFLSLTLFHIFASLINQWFRPYVEKLIGFPVQEGLSFCRLSLPHVSAAFLATIFLSSFAAIIAALRITRIEPAEALRDE